MPELPEVETIKEALRKAVCNSRIIKTHVRNRQLRVPIPEGFEDIMTNSVIIEIYRRAKYAIMKLDNGHSIVMHFGMSGKIKICNVTPENFEKHDHVIIQTTSGTVIYNDARRFGLIVCVKTADIDKHPIFAHTGIDPFDSELTGAYLFNKLTHKKSAIKIALLDQSIINGIGNIYASESLYDAGISPLRPCCDISPEEAETLVSSIQKVLRAAIKAGGSTLRDYSRPDGSLGYFQHQHCVYNKTGQPCPNCTCDIQETGGVAKITQAGRSTYYCKQQQK